MIQMRDARAWVGRWSIWDGFAGVGYMGTMENVRFFLCFMI